MLYFLGFLLQWTGILGIFLGAVHFGLVILILGIVFDALSEN